MNDVMAMILAGGQGDRLSILSEQRAKPAVVFGGHYRIIDFALSNVANSDIDKVAVLTQYRPRSLVNHIGAGRAWGLDRLDSAVQILQPYLGRADMDWYQGTADAVYQNLYAIEESHAEEILILAGDHIYLTSYRNLVAYHRRQNADVTVAVYSVPREEATRFGVLDLDSDGRMIDFEEKPANPRSPWVSMGVYCFDKDVLVEQLQVDADLRATSAHDFGRDIIPRLYKTHRVFGYQYQGYWRDVGTIESYWEAHMDLLAPRPDLDLYQPGTMLRSTGTTRPPSKFGQRSNVQQSLISPGAVINGTVRHSVISPGVIVEEGAEVIDSVLQHGTIVRAGAVVHRAIVDKEVDIGRGAMVGVGDSTAVNRERPDIVHAGITILGKRAVLPDDFRVGKNVVVGPGVRDELLDLGELAAGDTVHPEHMPLHLFV